jgi:hypothetical protein
VRNNFSSYSHRASVRVRKLLFRKKISDPFLSGDLFSSLAEFQVNSTEDLLRLKSLNSRPRSIFFKSEIISKIDNFLPSDFRADILIAGNSDLNFTNIAQLPTSFFGRFYLQNSMISDNKNFFTLPIGLENLRLGENGLPSLMSKNSVNVNRTNKILIGPFSPTHSERNDLMNLNQDIPFIKKIDHRIHPKQMCQLHQEFTFVACPRGNGVDTHRFWEVLYRGAIPIVRKSKWSSSLRILKIPFVEIESWTTKELKNVLESHNFHDFNPKDIEALWSPYWKNLL